ncbi:hypothetical protein [Paenibacillus oryzisoli]|uniref:Uncharacterized protein n=1 Tax=Paenibacillus oryzisoli TaxID=1850517 RepID=A0A198ARF8_9BACL|nr:hypothetical protein [Paenibacillus oryzisoli]OAS23581.1 hypothetical protein A8708_25820 [Paenibacillus oryzisoli]
MYLAQITKYMSVSLLILTFLNYFELLVLPTAYLMGFALSALTFTFIDLLDYNVAQSNDPFKFRRLKDILYFIAVSLFMVIPFLDINWEQSVLEKVNDMTVLLSVSIIFYVNSLKHKKMVSEQLDNIISTYMQEFLGSEEHKKIVEAAVQDGIKQVNIKDATFAAIEEYKNSHGE